MIHCSSRFVVVVAVVVVVPLLLDVLYMLDSQHSNELTESVGTRGELPSGGGNSDHEDAPHCHRRRYGAGALCGNIKLANDVLNFFFFVYVLIL